jgi:uncharacterized membrane protein YeaQ/YmgE (transglycosylase-associated protein family)
MRMTEIIATIIILPFVIILGGLVGVLARAVLPGRQAYGWLLTILLGTGGALIGYLLWGALLAPARPASTGLAGWSASPPRQCLASSTTA